MLDPLEEAEKCKSQAIAYLGRPEASFLLRVARGFERLASDRDQAVIEREPVTEASDHARS